MKPGILVCPGTRDLLQLPDAFYIGVDAGVEVLLEAGILPDAACGDFDSLDESRKSVLKALKDVELSPVRKNESDTELALLMAQEKGLSPIYVCGALGGRIDHELANLSLVMHRNFPVVLWEKDQRVVRLDPGEYSFSDQFRHVSFFPIGEAEISLQGFDYPLDHRRLHPRDIYTLSNRVIDSPATVQVHAGSVLCVQTDRP